MTSLTSDSLRFVDTFVLEMNTILATVDFSKLTSLNQIQWNGLPALSEGSISMPVTSVQSINIQSTFLSTFDGLGLDRLKTVGTLWVANNPYEEHDLDIARDGHISAFDASFRNVSELSIPALATVNGSLLLQGNNIDTFSAAALKAVESNLGFSSNSYLVDISLPALTTIGGKVTLYDNENLTSVSFAELETVDGAVNMSGTYKDVAFPSMQKLHGALSLTTSAELDCTALQQAAESGAIEGGLTCADKRGTVAVAAASSSTGTSSPTNSASTSDDTLSSSSSATLSTGGKIGVGVGVAGAAVAVASLSALVYVLRRNRKRENRDWKGKERREEKKDGQPSPPPQELPANNIQELEAGQLMNEMDAERGFVEAPPGNRVISELPGDHTRKESMEKGAELP